MRKKNLKLKNIIILLLMLIFLIIFVFSLIKIVNYYKDNQKTKEIDNVLKESIEYIKEDNKETSQEITKEKYEVNFNKLKEINKNTVGYLKVLGTNIDYVIVKGNDNSYYLNHDFNNQYNVLGWPFADFRNKFDGTDKNIIIYGHNVKTGVMFGTLKNVLTSDWQKNTDNQKLVFITDFENTTYEVFSTYTIKPEDYYITTDFNNEEEYQEFLDKISKRSNHNYNVQVSTNDEILTLSSCTNSGLERVVLHAKKIK